MSDEANKLAEADEWLQDRIDAESSARDRVARQRGSFLYGDEAQAKARLELAEAIADRYQAQADLDAAVMAYVERKAAG